MVPLALVTLALVPAAPAPAVGANAPAIGSPESFPPGERVLSVAPAIATTTVDAGSDTTLTFTVANKTLDAWPFEVKLQDAAPGSKAEGGVRFVERGTTDRGAAGWLQPATPRFRLASGEERDILVRVHVPADAAPGDHYAAVVFEAQPRATGSLDLRTQVSPLVLLTVRCALRHEVTARLVPDRRIHGGPPLRWTVEVRNRGNVHEQLAGRVRIDPVLGPASSVALRPMLLLPGTVRRQHVSFDVRNAPDLVGARLTLHQGAGARGAKLPAPASPRVLVLPWWLLAVAAALVVLAWWRRRRRRSWVDHHPGDGWDDADPTG